MVYIEKVLTPESEQEAFEFGQRELEKSVPDSFERMMMNWNSSWRSEALAHYSQTGWSFYLREPSSNKICGVILAQMVLFFNGQTQSLWVEDVAGDSELEIEQLLEIAIRWAKDKHLQKVFFAPTINLKNSRVIKEFSGRWTDGQWIVNTTKSSN